MIVNCQLSLQALSSWVVCWHRTHFLYALSLDWGASGGGCVCVGDYFVRYLFSLSRKVVNVLVACFSSACKRWCWWNM